MKGWMFVLLLAIALVLALSGCAQQPEEEGMINEGVGGDEVNQSLESIQALGTQLDKQPAHTETATFALG